MNMVSKLKVSHSYSELEQLQRGKADVAVTWFLALKWLSAKTPSKYQRPICQFFIS